MDGSVLAVLAAYQNNLVTSKNDDVKSGSMLLLQMSTKVDFRSESVNCTITKYLPRLPKPN